MLKKLEPRMFGETPADFEFETRISGTDLFESETLYRLALDPEVEREAYLIRTETGRPDLVAKDYYGDTRYESYVILQAGGIREIRAGNIVWLATPAGLKRILGS